MVPGEETAEEREPPRLRDEIELQLVHHVADDRARAEDLDLRLGRRRVTERGGEIPEEPVTCLLIFHLHERVGAIDRRREERVGDTDRPRRDHGRGDEPARAHEHVQVLAQRRLVLAGIGGRKQLVGYTALGSARKDLERHVSTLRHFHHFQ
jgi:hypothetical protein